MAYKEVPVIKYSPPPPPPDRPAAGGPNVTGSPPSSHSYHGTIEMSNHTSAGSGKNAPKPSSPMPATGVQQSE